VLVFKGGAAVFQFLLLVLTARWFGVAFRGEVALFNASLQLLVLLVGFAGGVSIAFLAARDPDRESLVRLVGTAWGACVLLPPIALVVARGLGWQSGPHVGVLAAVAVLQGMLVVNVAVLLAGRAVWQAGLLEFLRPFALVALAAAVRALRGFQSPDEFYLVWLVASGLAFVASLPFVVAHHRALPSRTAGPPRPWRSLVRDLLANGSLAQAGNVAQFLNYRWLFFAIERHAGLAAVGLFSTAVAFAEVMWIPVNSLAALALNRVTREPAAATTRAFVLRLVRLALLAMGAAALLGTLLPMGFVTALLGRDFAGVRALFLQLLPGVVPMGVATIAGSYHAGHGRYGVNLTAALFGLAVTAPGFFLVIPRLGVPGAVLAMNLSYAVTALALLVPMLRRERVRVTELLPRPVDLAGSAPGRR
jgi:O-antigen/teichoic acid export membrane protein